jgi:hypothetical protein
MKSRAWVLSCLILAGYDAQATTLYAAVLNNTADKEEEAP